MSHKALAAAVLAALLCPTARADEPGNTAPATDAVVTPFTKVGDITFYRSFEDAFPKARKEGKLVFVYRMLGELDGLT